MSMMDWLEGFFSDKTMRNNAQDYSEITIETVHELPQEIILKEGSFDASKIKEYNQSTKKFLYRPQTLNEYIGQENAKNLVRLNLKKIETLRPVHFLISGKKGCGKSTMAYLLKNLLNAEMIEYIASEIVNPEQVVDIVNRINYKENGELRAEKENVILFIDETHALPPKMCEIFYPILEDYKISGKNIKPFIFIGATTEKNELIRKVAPLIDRIQVQIELENYTDDNLITILKQYLNKMYLEHEHKIEEFKFRVIAENCKNTPRIAITLLEDCLIESNMDYVLRNHRIVSRGLTDIDYKIMLILRNSPKPMGEAALAQACGISLADYRIVYEPYLVENEMITRTLRGRTIGYKGLEVLG